MDQQALEQLMRRVGETHSDALIILQHGQTVCEWFSNRPQRPIHLMSCTKAVVSLAFGRLLDDGLLSSLDQPVSTIYPEWKQGRKQDITIRMLLNHTSGLQNVPNAGLEIELAPDVVQLALAAELDCVPGSSFSYNNKAVNLLAGVVHRLTERRLDHYIHDVLCIPLAIIDYQWITDPSGTPYVMAGLSLLPHDFAKLGQLVVQHGIWNGTQIVSEDWLREALHQSQPYNPKSGLLWWRILEQQGGQPYGYYTEGWLGQYLVIVPGHELVAIRLVQRREGYNHVTDGFTDFIEYVRALC